MRWEVKQGDCRELLAAMPDESVHCCVTSPPYFGLRDYGHSGQIGLEPTPAEYVAKLVEVFREVRRVLRDDGTLWLNLGDSYAGYHGNKNSTVPTSATNGWTNGTNENERTSTANRNGLKPKDLIGIPWRVAFALQADGWYLRQDIIWHKPNPMPESVRDRCTKAHEYLFLLSKSERYYFDSEAMQEPATGAVPGNRKHKHTSSYEAGDSRARTKAGLVAYSERQRSKRDSFKRDASKRAEVIPNQTVGTHRPEREESAYPIEKRNKRSVWTVATKPYPEAHFATYPPALIEPCILAGCPPTGVVLDPFTGSGTTGAVAIKHARQFVGCELNGEYIKLAEARIQKAYDEALW